MEILFILLIVILMLHGKPLFAVLGAVTLLFRYYATPGGGGDIDPVFSGSYQFFNDQSLLIAVPLFTLVGYLIANTKAPQRFVKVFRLITQPIFGNSVFAMGVLAIIISAIFTPLTGAAGVTIVALGGILFPMMANQLYPDKLNIGIITASGSIGLLIFPSLPIIVYTIFANSAVRGIEGVNFSAEPTDLFIAGILPTVLLILLPSLYVVYSTRKITGTDAIEKVEWNQETKKDVKRFIIEVAIIPVTLGLFMWESKVDIQEFGVIFLIYYGIVELLIFKEMPIKKLVDVCENALTLVGGILIIGLFGYSFTEYLNGEGVPEKIFQFITGFVGNNKLLFLLLINVFLLIVGALMDIFSAIIVISPLVAYFAAKNATNFDIDPIHLGILFLTNLELGYLTPPVGINLFISSFRFKKPLIDVYKAVAPFLFILIFTQLMITYVPQFSLAFISSKKNKIEQLQKTSNEEANETDEDQGLKEAMGSDDDDEEEE